MNITIWGMKSSVTNMTNMHTCTIGGVNLITPMVFVPERQLLQVAGDMVGGAGIRVPVGVDGVGVHCSSDKLRIWHIIFIKSVPAPVRRVPALEAHLAKRVIIIFRWRDTVIVVAKPAMTATPIGVATDT